MTFDEKLWRFILVWNKIAGKQETLSFQLMNMAMEKIFPLTSMFQNTLKTTGSSDRLQLYSHRVAVFEVFCQHFLPTALVWWVMFCNILLIIVWISILNSEDESCHVAIHIFCKMSPRQHTGSYFSDNWLVQSDFLFQLQIIVKFPSCCCLHLSFLCSCPPTAM